MKKILAIIQRDVKSGLRDWLIVYLSIAPFLIALILKLFIPAAQDSLITIGTIETDPLVSILEPYAKVNTFETEDLLIERVKKRDDFIAVISVGEDKYRLIKQGNETIDYSTSIKALLYDHFDQEVNLPINIKVTDIGFEMSPLKIEGGILLILFTTVFGGMFIVLNMVEEKMSNTIKALNVTTTTRLQVVLGKGFIGFCLPIVGSLGSVLILGFTDIPYGLFLLTVISIALISLIIGFVIGILNNEPIAAVASMKIVFMPVLLSVFGAIFLKESLHFLLYWSPYYWAYKSMKSVLLNQATLSEIGMNSGIILIITLMVFLALRKKITEGFQ